MLSTPPAFILSQDQTLYELYIKSFDLIPVLLYLLFCKKESTSPHMVCIKRSFDFSFDFSSELLLLLTCVLLCTFVCCSIFNVRTRPLSQALGQYITSSTVCQGVLQKFLKKFSFFCSLVGMLCSAGVRSASRVANRCYYSTEKVESQPAKVP